jgi:AcrR family transcriptional regulator
MKETLLATRIASPSGTMRKAPRQARSRATIDVILDAAAHILGDRGWTGLTTNTVAEIAGVSIGSLYQYFPNKDSILVELVRLHVESGVARIAARLTDPSSWPETLDGKVRLFVRATVDNHRDDPRLHRVLFEEAPRPPSLLAELHAIERTTVQAVEGLLADEPSVRRRDNPAVTAYLVVAAIESLTHRYVSSRPDDAPFDPFIDELVALVVGYLTSRPVQESSSAT